MEGYCRELDLVVTLPEQTPRFECYMEYQKDTWYNEIGHVSGI